MGDSGTGRVFAEDILGGVSGAGGVDGQVEGISRLSIVPEPKSRVGRCGTFEGEKRKFLSVNPQEHVSNFLRF